MVNHEKQIVGPEASSTQSSPGVISWQLRGKNVIARNRPGRRRPGRSCSQPDETVALKAFTEAAVGLQRNPAVTSMAGKMSHLENPNMGLVADTPLERKFKTRKVNNTDHLSKLSRWILANAGDGIARADIVAMYFNIERLYCGFYLDPCYSPNERRRHRRRYRYSQPRGTMTLKRLEQRGLVHLVRRKQYVTKVELTDRGQAVARELKSNELDP